MSDIQAIATNNYVLHNIDAKKLYVQEPLFTANSGDAVYVGWRPDETVLWEGSMYLSANSTFTANDSFKNYDKIDFYILEHYEVGDVHIDSHKGGTLTTGNIQRYDIFCPGLPEGATGTIRFNHAVITGANNSSIYKVNAAGQNSIQDSSLVKATCPSKLIKVVGINRKENA